MDGPSNRRNAKAIPASIPGSATRGTRKRVRRFTQQRSTGYTADASVMHKPSTAPPPFDTSPSSSQKPYPAEQDACPYFHPAREHLRETSIRRRTSIGKRASQGLLRNQTATERCRFRNQCSGDNPQNRIPAKYSPMLVSTEFRRSERRRDSGCDRPSARKLPQSP